LGSLKRALGTGKQADGGLVIIDRGAYNRNGPKMAPKGGPSTPLGLARDIRRFFSRVLPAKRCRKGGPCGGLAGGPGVFAPLAGSGRINDPNWPKQTWWINPPLTSLWRAHHRKRALCAATAFRRRRFPASRARIDAFAPVKTRVSRKRLPASPWFDKVWPSDCNLFVSARGGGLPRDLPGPSCREAHGGGGAG